MDNYDILIRGGTVLDPSQELNGRRDVGVRDGKIAAVKENIPSSSATNVVDASGKLVTPGLIDLHAHVYWKFTRLSLEPDELCGRTGVTTVVDVGTAGAVTFAGFRHFIIERAKTRIIPLLHVTSFGLVTDKECRSLDHIDIDLALECIRENRDMIAGIKVRANRMGVGDQAMMPVYMARDLADASGLPMMVDMYYPPPSVEQIFPMMRPGDISTHMYKGYTGGLTIDWNTRVRPSAIEARGRGILFDLGHGGGSFAWDVAVPACEQGFYPDTISTDLHAGSVQLPDCDMPNCMSKLMALGASLEDVVRWSTVNCAKAMRRADLGTLRVGGPADVTVLEMLEGDQTFYDVRRKTFNGKHRLRARYTLCQGVVTYDALTSTRVETAVATPPG
jgi:dihydroorotase